MDTNPERASFIAAVIGATTVAALTLVVVAYAQCSNANGLLEPGTDRERLCGSLPAGAAWWLIPGLAPVIAVIALVITAPRRRRVVIAGSSVVFVVSLVYVAYLGGQRSFSTAP